MIYLHRVRRASMSGWEAGFYNYLDSTNNNNGEQVG